MVIWTEWQIYVLSLASVSYFGCLPFDILTGENYGQSWTYCGDFCSYFLFRCFFECVPALIKEDENSGQNRFFFKFKQSDNIHSK